MGWLEAREHYKTGETLAGQNVEDLVARRVLRGLGLVSRQVPEIERALHIKGDTYDQPLWLRTRTILQAITTQSDRQWVFGVDEDTPGLFRIDVRETDPHHKEILELSDMLCEAHTPYPLFLTRVKNTQVSLAYFLMRHEDTDNHKLHITASWLKPPVQFIGDRKSTRLNYSHVLLQHISRMPSSA